MGYCILATSCRAALSAALKKAMKTPYGRECRFYYQDFFRGHAKQECRLIGRNPDSERWQPALCRDCPVPAILRDNACPNMALEAKIVRGLLGLTRRVQVYAVCTLSVTEVQEPRVGCGQCHRHRPGAAIFSAQEK